MHIDAFAFCSAKWHGNFTTATDFCIVAVYLLSIPAKMFAFPISLFFPHYYSTSAKTFGYLFSFICTWHCYLCFSQIYLMADLCLHFLCYKSLHLLDLDSCFQTPWWFIAFWDASTFFKKKDLDVQVKYLKSNEACRINEKSHKANCQLIHSIPDHFVFQDIKNTTAVLAKRKCGNSLLAWSTYDTQDTNVYLVSF